MRTLVLLTILAAAAVAQLRGTDNLTLCDPNVKQYAGYMDIDPTTEKQYFYWAFTSRSDPATDPVVLWMTGGPGCSSGVALFGENGPCTVNADGASTTPNPYSWNNNANMIYIDQPAGVGFSKASNTGYDSNETQVANDMYAFLQAFYKAHPEWHHNDFYIFGESYGGHYAPATAHKIYTENKMGNGIPIPLKGVGIGNGLTNPEIQYKYYPQMAYNYSITKIGKPVVSEIAYALMELNMPKCIELIRECNGKEGDSKECLKAMMDCEYAELVPYQVSGRNPYDIRLPCEVPPLCYNMSAISTYLNSPTVQAQLGVSGWWQSCNTEVTRRFALAGDWMRMCQTYLPDMLNDGIRVLVYAGDCDFICNWLGNKAWTLALDWAHKSSFDQAPDVPYMLDGKEAGEMKSAMGLSFLRVYDAGHMVPRDQPEVALGMLKEFIRSQ